MKFEVRHHFALTPQQLWEVLFSPAYEAATAAQGDMDRELVDDRAVGETRERKTRVTSRKEYPAAMRKAIGGRLSYMLVETHRPAEHRLDWDVVPDKMANKIKANGSYQIVAAPGGCERLVKGEIKVSIPLLGGNIEKAIGEELRASYERAADFARKWIAENP